LTLAGLADHEAGDVDELFANGDLSLADKDTGLMDGFGKVALEHKSLEATLHELGDGKSQDKIEFALGSLENTESHHTPDKGLTFEDSSGIFGIHGQKNTSSLSELGEDELLAPDLSLASQTVLADQTKTKHQTFVMECPDKSSALLTR